MRDYSYIYPEIGQSRYPVLETTPTFPDTCPVCGAAATVRGNRYHPVSYACGGSYDDKPQIQNHTDKWWGVCPIRRAEIEATAR
jgi:hypothetical protein